MFLFCFVFPEAKGTLSSNFSLARYKDGAIWGCWELPEEKEKIGPQIVIASTPKTSSQSLSFFGKNKLLQTRCSPMS